MVQLSRLLRSALLAVFILPQFGAIASAQISVSPTRLLLDMRGRSTEVTVLNTASSPVEVTADLGFKLIRSDSLGNMRVDTMGSPEELGKSCRSWIKIFPRKFILAPNASRTMRVMIEPTSGIADGEYWGRLIVGGVMIDGRNALQADTNNGITTSMSMRLELDLPVIFRKGPVETGITFSALHTVVSNDGRIIALLDLSRSGNSAYRGTLRSVLRNSKGEEVASTSDQFTAEFVLRHRIMLPKLTDGHYVLELESRSEKKGSANDAVIASPTVLHSYNIDVWGSKITVTE